MLAKFEALMAATQKDLPVPKIPTGEEQLLWDNSKTYTAGKCEPVAASSRPQSG